MRAENPYLHSIFYLFFDFLSIVFRNFPKSSFDESDGRKGVLFVQMAQTRKNQPLMGGRRYKVKSMASDAIR